MGVDGATDGLATTVEAVTTAEAEELAAGSVAVETLPLD